MIPYSTREEIGKLAADSYKGRSDMAIANSAGQLWALRGRITPGDLMVLPLKTTRQIAIGRVTGPYMYRDDPDPEKRHIIPVEWVRSDLPRSAVKQDLLFTLGSAMSVFSPSKNNAVARLESLLADGVDPGQAVFMGPSLSQKPGTPVDHTEDVDEPELSPDIEEAARDQITAKIEEEFSGHELTTLVAALLEVEGFRCRKAPPGPDGGIDIIAGRGVLGLDDMIVVQVKSGNRVESPVVSQLHGVMSEQGATQGLLVAWGGLTRPAQAIHTANQNRVRVWEADDVVDATLASYEKLSEDIRSRIPFKRVWMLADSGD
jgi:restriction system protein